MSEWSTYRFGDVTINFDGRRVPIKSADRRKGPYPYYGASGVIDWVDDYIFDGEYLLIAEDGENLRTRTTPIAFTSTGKFWVNNHAHIVQGNQHANTRYLGYLLSRTEVSGYLSGSTQPKLTQAAMNSITVRLPDRAYQDVVVGLLGALDDKIAANGRLVASSHELAQAHVSRLAREATRGHLAEVADITMGSSPPGDTYNESNVGLPFYQGARDFGTRSPSPRVWCSEPVRTAESGATLVSVRAPVGRLNVATEKCCIGRGVAALASASGTPSVLFHSLNAVPDLWSPFASEGTVFGSINKKQLERLPVPILDRQVARALEATLAPLDARVRVAFMETQTLGWLRNALLPGLMSGEIRVRDAERVAQEAT